MRILAFLLILAGCGADARGEVHREHGAPAAAAAAAGPMTVDVAPDVAKLLHIRTEPATQGEESVARRGPAMVSWDPFAVTRVTVQAGGQLRELLLPRPGEPVARGAVVARVYQPEVRAAFEELLVAAKLGEPWLTAATTRLVATGVAASDVKRALANGEAPDTFAVRAPTDGIVLEHPVKEGSWVAPGGVVAVVGDPAALVVEMVVTGAPPAIGAPVTLRDPASGAQWAANVASVLPSADAAGLRVRVIPTTPVPVGRPLVAEWSDPGVAGVWVPRTALVDTGLRRVVFVETSPGRYEPRKVQIGPAAGDRVQILAGVTAGEPVVVSGTFLLDSETQIGAAGHAAHGVAE